MSKRLRFILVVLIAAVVSGLSQVREDEKRSDLEQRIERYLQPYRDRDHLSGTLLIARKGRIVFEKSYGMANREHGVPNTPQTRFGVGSVNKPMTIVLLARLLDGNKLALTDPLSKFIPAFPRAADITVDHLLKHQAGIPHRVTAPVDETRPQTAAGMVKLAAAKPLVFDPGSDSSYSSAGFSVLARVLEIAGGKPYADLLQEHVLAPAGMKDTSDAGTRGLLPRRASSYYFDTHGFLNAPPQDMSYLVGAGSIFSTPRDLHALQQALFSGKLGERAREILVHEDGDLRWNGLASGYRAFADHDAGTGTTVIMATNITSGAVDAIRAALPRIVAGEDVPALQPVNATAVDVPARVLERYLGPYELRAGRNLELRLVDGRVLMGEWLLIPTSRTTFFSPQDYGEIEVVLDESGKVLRLDWTTGDRTHPMPRVPAAPAS